MADAFDAQWNAEQNTWFNRPDGNNARPGKNTDYDGVPKATLIAQTQAPNAPKGLFNYLYYGKTDQIYPDPAQYRAWVVGPGQPPVNLRGDPRLAEVVDRPAKMRQFGVKAERAAWAWLCDTL